MLIGALEFIINLFLLTAVITLGIAVLTGQFWIGPLFVLWIWWITRGARRKNSAPPPPSL